MGWYFRVRPIPFLAQNDGESIGNLNYSWHNVFILCMRGMEGIEIKNFVLLSVNKRNPINERCMVDSKCQEIAYFNLAMLRQKMQHLYQSILR